MRADPGERLEDAGMSARVQAGLLVACVMAGAALTALAPPERALGDGIRVVYLHVAFTWAGLTGFVAMAALGLRRRLSQNDQSR